MNASAEEKPGLDVSFCFVLICFFLSGFAALLYETAWTREFAFVFGTSELAVVSVLASYMGGLACGAAAAARLAPRIRRPVLIYGVLELLIALCALAVPFAIRGSSALYVWLVGGQATPLEGEALLGVLFNLGASFLILILPAGFMGATLPLLARHAVRSEEQIGRRIGVLYATNTAGAIAGTLVAGFVLLPSIGLRNTIYCGAAVNALVFVFAVLLARSSKYQPPPEAPAESALIARTGRWVLPLIAISGIVSFSYEVLWFRLLANVLGSSTHAFATMLASFLLGISIGSALAAPQARNPRRAAVGFAIAQVGAAVLSLIAFRSVNLLAEFAVELGSGAKGSIFANAAVAALALAPSALCLGATFPFAVRVLARDKEHAAAASARVFAWNTLGAIVGAIGAGFFFLPTLGFRGTITAAACVNLLIALAASLFTKPAVRPLAAVAAAGVALVALIPPSTPWKMLFFNPIGGTVSKGRVSFFAVGRSSTVLVMDEGKGWRVKTNGLPESLIPHEDEERTLGLLVARWLTALPVLARPDTRSMLVIGLGGGLALEFIPREVESVHVIELETEVVNANRAIAELRGHSPLDDPRIEIGLNDARGALALTERRYDSISSQPSHPWTAGASHLYTREFFSLVRDHLEPEGVFVQWIAVPFVDKELLRSLTATLLDVFPHVRAYQPSGSGLLFLSSGAPLDVEAQAARAIATDPGLFAHFGLFTVEDVTAAVLMDEEQAREIAAGAPLNTDDRNQIAMRAGAIPVRGARSSLDVFEGIDRRPPVTDSLDTDYLVRRLLASGASQRATDLAETLPEPAGRNAALGWTSLAQNKPRAAERSFEAALELDPTSQSARFGLLRTRNTMGVPLNGDRHSEAQLRAPVAAVLKGWRYREAKDWEALRALDPELAEIPFRDVTFSDALGLRAQWRAMDSDPELANEAIEMLDQLMYLRRRIADQMLRAQAGLTAQRPRIALTSLERIAAASMASKKPFLGGALEILRALPESPRTKAIRRRLTKRPPS